MSTMEAKPIVNGAASAEEPPVSTVHSAMPVVAPSARTEGPEISASEPRRFGEQGRTAQTLLYAILRLEAIIDEEIAALQSLRRVDYDGFSRRKNRGLLELVRSSKASAGADRDPQLAGEIARLRTKLDKNRALLLLHFDAVRAVADIICKSLREAESDGTYVAASRAGK